MEILNQLQTLEALCLYSKKWGMFISWGELIFNPELLEAAPYLAFPRDGQAILEGQAYILFDTEEEMMHHYDQTVGDDGPTESNDYNGSYRVYAITCDPDGQLGYENT